MCFNTCSQIKQHRTNRPPKRLILNSIPASRKSRMCVVRNSTTKLTVTPRLLFVNKKSATCPRSCPRMFQALLVLERNLDLRDVGKVGGIVHRQRLHPCWNGTADLCTHKATCECGPGEYCTVGGAASKSRLWPCARWHLKAVSSLPQLWAHRHLVTPSPRLPFQWRTRPCHVSWN